MTIAYKVVGKKHRYGSNVTIFLKQQAFGPKKFSAWQENNKTLWKEVKKYFLSYKKGTIVKASKNSFGIMCFDTFGNAETFRDQWSELSDAKIIKVAGSGEIRKFKEPLYIPMIIDFKYLQKKHQTDRPSYCGCPEGIISFSEVEVLE